MVKTLVRRGLVAFTSKQTNIFSAAVFITLTTIITYILGLVKYRLFGAYFGASDELGIFLTAFRAPEFIFQITVTALTSAAFIPFFASYLEHGKKEQADRFASSILTTGGTVFVLIAVVVVLFANPIANIIAPGFSPEHTKLMASFMRYIMVSQIFMMLALIFTAILQSYHKFLIPGLANSLYNIGIIIGTILFVPVFGIHGVALGVILGAFLFAASQIPILKQSGFSFKPNLSLQDGINKILPYMIPRSVALTITQIALTANVFFASFISARSYVILEYAQILMLAPVVLIGNSIAQASFPSLAKKVKNAKEFSEIYLASFRQIIYLTFPLTALFIVLRIPLVRIAWGAQNFDWPATVNTGLTLAIFSISIPAQSLLNLTLRAYYAKKDTRTPLVITAVSVAINIVLAFIFIQIQQKQIHFLALAYAVSYIFAFLLLTTVLQRKVQFPVKSIVISGSKITVATIAMGAALFIPVKLLDQLVFDTTRTINLLFLTGIASTAGFAAYFFFTWLLEIEEAYGLLAVVKRYSSKDKILKQIQELIDGPTLNP